MSFAALEHNLALLDQGKELLESLPDALYFACPEPATEIPAIGPHFRHCVDFYHCFLEGLDLRMIDYNARQRRREIEEERGSGLLALHAIADRLGGVSETEGDGVVEIRLEGPSGPDRDLGEWSRSTVRRELQFLMSHTLHHYALVSLTLRLGGHPVPEDFGVAPSTLASRRGETSCAR